MDEAKVWIQDRVRKKASGKDTSWWRQPDNNFALWIRTHIRPRTDMTDRIEAIAVLTGSKDVVYLEVQPFRYAELKMQRDFDGLTITDDELNKVKEDSNLIYLVDPQIFEFISNKIKQEDRCGIASFSECKDILTELSCLKGFHVCERMPEMSEVPELKTENILPLDTASFDRIQQQAVKDAVVYWTNWQNDEQVNLISSTLWGYVQEDLGILVLANSSFANELFMPDWIDEYRERAINRGRVDDAYYYESDLREEYTSVRVMKYLQYRINEKNQSRVETVLPEARFFYGEVPDPENKDGNQLDWGIFVPVECIEDRVLLVADVICNGLDR